MKVCFFLDNSRIKDISLQNPSKGNPGISAIEFQALGIPVATKKTYGLLNTVNDKKTGILTKNDAAFVDGVVRLLKKDDYNKKMGENGRTYVTNLFDIHLICQEWEKILNTKLRGVNKYTSYTTINYSQNLKWLREGNRILKKLSFLKWLPAISEYPEVIYNLDLYKKLSSLKRGLKR